MAGKKGGSSRKIGRQKRNGQDARQKTRTAINKQKARMAHELIRTTAQRNKALAR